MIIDVTEQFRTKFTQYYKINQSIEEENSEAVVKKQQKPFKQSRPYQYAVQENSAKTIYLSLCKIDQILKDKKDNYFSNAAYSLTSFTNQQRNQFDQQTKTAFKTCSDRIDQLKSNSQKFCKSFENSKNEIFRSSQTYSQNLKQIILCLHHYFKKLQNQFTEFLKYNEQKKKKILNTLSIEPQVIHKQPKYFQKRSDHNNIESADIQNVNAQLERQAHMFYLQKMQDQKKAIQTKHTIESINSMLGQMSKKVLDQQLLTSSFEQIGSVGLNYIDQSNKNLLQANNYSKTGGKYWVLYFLGLTASLLLVDFLKS